MRVLATPNRRSSWSAVLKPALKALLVVLTIGVPMLCCAGSAYLGWWDGANRLLYYFLAFGSGVVTMQAVVSLRLLMGFVDNLDRRDAVRLVAALPLRAPRRAQRVTGIGRRGGGHRRMDAWPERVRRELRDLVPGVPDLQAFVDSRRQVPPRPRGERRVMSAVPQGWAARSPKTVPLRRVTISPAEGGARVSGRRRHAVEVPAAPIRARRRSGSLR